MAIALESNQTLTSLNLSLLQLNKVEVNYIGEQGGKKLADALKNNRTLTKLNLGNFYLNQRR